MIDKKAVPTKLLWVDLEMTGLDANQDVILEVAAEVTDFNMVTLASYEARVQQPREVVVDRMQKNNWWADFPANRDDFVSKLSSGKPSDQVEQELITLLQEHFGDEPAVLAGNAGSASPTGAAGWCCAKPRPWSPRDGSAPKI